VVKTTNREVWEAFEAMAMLVNRGWKSGKIALALGKTFRRLREKREDIDQARTALLAEYAARSEDGGFAKETSGDVRLRDPIAFNEAWRELLEQPVEVEVFPVKMKTVEEAKVQLTAFQYEILTNFGILEDGKPEEKGKKDTTG